MERGGASVLHTMNNNNGSTATGTSNDVVGSEALRWAIQPKEMKFDEFALTMSHNSGNVLLSNGHHSHHSQPHYVTHKERGQLLLHGNSNGNNNSNSVDSLQLGYLGSGNNNNNSSSSNAVLRSDGRRGFRPAAKLHARLSAAVATRAQAEQATASSNTFTVTSTSSNNSLGNESLRVGRWHDAVTRPGATAGASTQPPMTTVNSGVATVVASSLGPTVAVPPLTMMTIGNNNNNSNNNNNIISNNNGSTAATSVSFALDVRPSSVKPRVRDSGDVAAVATTTAAAAATATSARAYDDKGNVATSLLTLQPALSSSSALSANTAAASAAAATAATTTMHHLHAHHGANNSNNSTQQTTAAATTTTAATTHSHHDVRRVQLQPRVGRGAVRKSKPLAPLLQQRDRHGLQVEGNSVRASDAVYASHALTQLTECTAVERTLREQLQAARYAKLQAFRAVNKVVVASCVEVGGASEAPHPSARVFHETLALARCAVVTNTLVSTIQSYVRACAAQQRVHARQRARREQEREQQQQQQQQVCAMRVRSGGGCGADVCHGMLSLQQQPSLSMAVSPAMTTATVAGGPVVWSARPTSSGAVSNMVQQQLQQQQQQQQRYDDDGNSNRHCACARATSADAAAAAARTCCSSGGGGGSSNCCSYGKNGVAFAATPSALSLHEDDHASGSLGEVLDAVEVQQLKQLYFDYYDCEVVSIESREWSAADGPRRRRHTSSLSRSSDVLEHSVMTDVSSYATVHGLGEHDDGDKKDDESVDGEGNDVDTTRLP